MRGRTQYKKLKRVGRSHYKKRSSRHQFLMSCFIINVGWQVQVLVHYTAIIWMRYVLPPSRYLFLCTLEHKCHEPTFLLVVFWGNLKILFVCVIAAVHSKSGTFYDIWIESSYLIFQFLLCFRKLFHTYVNLRTCYFLTHNFAIIFLGTNLYIFSFIGSVVNWQILNQPTQSCFSSKLRANDCHKLWNKLSFQDAQNE